MKLKKSLKKEKFNNNNNYKKSSNKSKVPKKIKKIDSILQNSPQIKAKIIKVISMSPKKPNSANRPVAVAQINEKQKQKKFNKNQQINKKRKIFAIIRGEKHNLQPHSTVLLQGRGAKDTPSVSYSVIRGILDNTGVENRKNGRSKYGTRKS